MPVRAGGYAASSPIIVARDSLSSLLSLRFHGHHTTLLKAEAEAETNLTLIGLRARDLGIAVQLADAAIRIANGIGYVGARVVEMRRIAGVKGFGTKLQLDFLSD